MIYAITNPANVCTFATWLAAGR